jgi:threonine dehydratase
MTDHTLADLEAATGLVHRVVPPTPQHRWPLLSARAGAEVWVKHENHTPVGAFKVRGGVVFMERLKAERPKLAGVITATRGNHGQSIAFGAARVGVPAVVVVPIGNSVEKNAAMRALGAELVEHGPDFEAAVAEARRLAEARSLTMLPSFHPWLVAGVASYSVELFRAVPDLDALYVPIGLGSGICGAMAARGALGLKAEIVGVVAENAPCYALSMAAGAPVSTNSSDTMADGMAVRVPNAEALAAIRAGVARIVRVGEAEIKAAMRHYFTDTHNLAEGAGAAPLAALLKEKERQRGKKVGLILSGGNIDLPLYRSVLAEDR